MKKEKVLILGKLPPPYMGPAIATQIILNSSLREKFDLLHIDTRANTSLHTMGKWSLKKIFRNIGIYRRMLGLVLRERPALVLIPISQSTGGYMKDFIFIAIAKLCRRKVLIQLRGSNFLNWLNGASMLTRSFVRRSLKLCQGVIVLGENLKPLFQDIFDEKRIFVVPNGGNYDLHFSVKSNSPLRILYLANLQASKGIEDVLHAIALINEQRLPLFRLIVVGEWRSEQTRVDCLKMVSEKKLPVEFHPAASGQAKLKFLSEADVFVFTPRMPEGHPWVIVEAMAAGLPIVSTDRGAIKESVRHGINGFIAEAENPSSIASEIIKLLSDQTLREKMGRESRRIYEEKFTEEKMAENLAITFNKIISG